MEICIPVLLVLAALILIIGYNRLPSNDVRVKDFIEGRGGKVLEIACDLTIESDGEGMRPRMIYIVQYIDSKGEKVTGRVACSLFRVDFY